ncbi:SusC/RagA family TonB-linked outer membrane protein [Flavobacterium hydrophilum]|uniref:TonB-dependent receptor n=1 Tax=Flavobacterium hydrophilum TaxID=2211445 RepID=A0A2V4C2I8_9FLAO|nr:TonB-dependent receptor [Flavobacterium hydrophilum]PXY45032.1 TonB-dependent receptor [Flavobacterium hydrophilum]
MITNQKLFLYWNFVLPKKEWLIALFMLVFSVNLMSAQGKEISGIVTSTQDKLPLPGVNVTIKGTKTGTTTGFDGQYSIKASPNDVLVFSFIGYQNKEVPVGNQSKVDIALGEDSNKLNEVVVIGYGTQKKGDLTGSISVVNMEDAKKTITYDPAKMLQGQVAGVTVQSSGEPGGFVNIKIRGINSFTNNNPLFVIDGMIVDSPYDFAPGDIESMQVLKDASSAAIYGVRGANGVIIITTKKGKLGKLDIKYKSLVGFQNVAKEWSLTDRVGYQTITNEAERNRDIRQGVPINIAPGNNPTSPYYINNVDTNWQDEAFQTGLIQNHSLTFNGGAESLGYNMNVDYFQNTSYLNSPQDYERLSMNLNLYGKKGKFKYGSKLGYTQSDKENFNSWSGASAIADLLGAIPTMPVYDANRLGGYGGTDVLTQKAISMNVIGFNNLITNNGKRNRFIGDIWGELEIVKGLKYKLDASFDRVDWQNRKYVPESDLGWYYTTKADKATLDVSTGHESRTFLNNLLTYEIAIGKHKIDALAGWIQERTDHYNHFSQGVGYKYGSISQLEYATVGVSTKEYNRTITGISYLSRLNYSFDDRYFVTGNFRQDKTSLFAAENNTGNFYSFSGAWKISSEKFIKLPEWFNTIKLRGGYGELGNNTIAPYAYTTTINKFAGYDFNNELAPGTTVVSAVDPNVSWENTSTTNVALELGFFNNDLQFTGEYYEKKSTGLLIGVPLPYSTGAFPASVVTNAGAVKNTGLEFTTTYNNRHHEFKYNISANLGTLKNEVTQIGINGNPIYGAASKTEVGRSIGEIFAWETNGIFQDAADLASSPTQSNAGIGDQKFKDVNGDGAITDADRTYQGVTIPKYSYGFNFSAEYKNFDFSMFWQGAGGHKVFNAMYRNLMIGDFGNHHTDMLNYWSPTNTDTNVPRPIIGDPNGNARDSNRFIEDGDYLKLQTMQIGYTIPLKENKFIQKANVYVNGQNLLILSKYKGYDPDFNSNDGLISRGYDAGSFPNPRTISLGVEIQF